MESNQFVINFKNRINWKRRRLSILISNSYKPIGCTIWSRKYNYWTCFIFFFPSFNSFICCRLSSGLNSRISSAFICLCSSRQIGFLRKACEMRDGRLPAPFPLKPPEFHTKSFRVVRLPPILPVHLFLCPCVLQPAF